MPIYSSRAMSNTVRVSLSAALGLLIFSGSLAAQSEASIVGARGGVSAGGEMDNYLRYLQTTGQVPLAAWGLRPFSAAEVDSLSKISGAHPWKNSWMFERDGAHHFSVLPVTANAGFNTAYPFGSNDGAVWAGRGLTTSLQAGIASAWGPVSLVLNPIVFRAENTGFTLAPNGSNGGGRFRDPNFPSFVDRPQRFGDTPYSRFDWGQSTLRIDGGGLTAGFSTANQYWGPATTFPVILGNNAAGVPHFFWGQSVQQISRLDGSRRESCTGLKHNHRSHQFPAPARLWMLLRPGRADSCPASLRRFRQLRCMALNSGSLATSTSPGLVG
jgi:hypothetical protein